MPPSQQVSVVCHCSGCKASAETVNVSAVSVVQVVPVMTYKELQAKVDQDTDGLVVVDVRDPEQYEQR